MLKKDNRQFLMNFLRNPRTVGAIAPSSKTLGKTMARQIDAQRQGYVVELGGGTGAITRELLNSGIDVNRLVIVERDETFFRMLCKQFPQVKVLKGDACHLKKLLNDHGVNDVSYVVSGLPLTNMPRAIRCAIMEQAFKVLASGGEFIQFTYSLISPVPKNEMQELKIEGKAMKRVWRNLPPARIWHYSAKPAA